MDDLMKNNPLFVRGAARVDTIVASGEKVASFTGITSPLASPGSPIQLFLPTDDKFLAWAARRDIQECCSPERSQAMDQLAFAGKHTTADQLVAGSG